MHSFKELKKNCISQVFSDTISKVHIVKYYTPQVCIAQGFTVHIFLLNTITKKPERPLVFLKLHYELKAEMDRDVTTGVTDLNFQIF